VPTLARGDAERLLRFVSVAEELATEEPVVPETLTELGRVVEADSVCYNELDRVRKRSLLAVERPTDVWPDSPELPLVWELLDEHPVCWRHQQGYVGALKLSDFVTLRDFRRTRLWNEWFHVYPVARVLNLALRSPLWHTRTFLFDRGAGHDFTERDRYALELLAPHLDRIWRGARMRRRLSAALAALEHASERDTRGVVLVGRAQDAELVSPPARRLLREFFPAARDGLPVEVTDWLAASSSAPLVVPRGERRLRVQRSGDALLLEEAWSGPGLTAREQQVLSWVARGKTNAEVAEVLWLSPGTVRKHLENAYTKLGVRTRTAAVARFLALVDADEDQPARQAESS
jgi:DNA-binding CsgD family transcriptional regulator